MVTPRAHLPGGGDSEDESPFMPLESQAEFPVTRQMCMFSSAVIRCTRPECRFRPLQLSSEILVTLSQAFE